MCMWSSRSSRSCFSLTILYTLYHEPCTQRSAVSVSVIKGLVEIAPILFTLDTVFAHVYRYAISELCKGLYHHNGVSHESLRPQIHRFRPQARAPPLGVCVPHQRCGDGEVSGSGVSEGVCEALTFMEWSTMVVPTYPGSHALQVCQHHHQVVRVGRFVGLSETGRTHVARDCSGRFG